MPEDIVIKILLWLPVESLLRLKLVCRDWLSLIESSHFVHQHRGFKNHSSSSSSLILLSGPPDRYDDTEQEFSFFSFEDDCEFLLDFPIIDDPFKITPVVMEASCHGIICLRQNRRVCLWNPATNKSTNLPPLPHQPINCHIGFGFDVATNYYKLVCINQTTVEWTAHIYISSSKYWRIIQGSISILDEPYAMACALNTPYRDTICCWLPFSDLIILSFDCTNEEFETIPLPQNILQTPKALFILRENIACINREGDYSETSAENFQKSYEVWMLNDYNVKDSWTRLYLIEPFSESLHWMTWFSKDGDFILFLERYQLCMYDVVAQQVKKLPVQVRDGFKVVTYEESLVSFERGSASAIALRSQGRNAIMSVNQSVTEPNSSWDGANITQVLVFKILLWLPVASLLRFKLVCKSWCSLIKSSEFVAQHLHLHQNDTENINFILLCKRADYDPLFEDSSCPSPASSYTCLLSTNKLKLLDLPYVRNLAITTSFDGIVCLRVIDDINFYLWNPATRQVRVVTTEPTRVLLRIDEERGIRVGFGFDVKTNVYKLVRFFKDCEITVVELYSLSTGSWRCLHDKILLTLDIGDIDIYMVSYRKGINCWVAQIGFDGDNYVILSFDFSKEVFETIALPDSINYETYFPYKLAVLSENIACIALDRYYNSKSAVDWHGEIWIMNEYGIKNSWMKLYTLGPFSQDWCWRTEYSTRNGNYILLQEDGQLYEFDLVTQETKKLPVQVQGPDYYDVFIYKESLVPIN